jgi:hypothetical protein
MTLESIEWMTLEELDQMFASGRASLGLTMTPDHKLRIKGEMCVE